MKATEKKSPVLLKPETINAQMRQSIEIINAILAGEADVHPHMSKGNDKLGDIPNWSLMPGVTCSKYARKGCLIGGCYAVKSGTRWNVKKAWSDNTYYALHNIPALEAYLNDYFGNIMTAPRFFRLHVAGDFATKEYAEMWARVARKAPWTMFMTYTKSFDQVRGVEFPSNFKLYLSDWPGMEIPADLREKYHVAWLLKDETSPRDHIPADAFTCSGNCEHCGKCWMKDADVIFYMH